MTREPRRAQETQAKIALAAQTLRKLAADKQQQRSWGQLTIKLFWEDGYLKTVEVSDVTTIKDLPRQGSDEAEEDAP